MNIPDLIAEHRFPNLGSGGGAVNVLVVRRGGDLHTVLGEHRADRFDTPPQTTPVTPVGMSTDEVHDQPCGRSNSAAKKADAAFKIAFARLSSAFSRFSRFSSADSSDVTPGRWPASTSA